MKPYICCHGNGYNSQYQLIEGDHYPNSCQTGNGITICPTTTVAQTEGITCPTSTCFITNQQSAVLIDSNLMIGYTLDYLNSAQSPLRSTPGWTLTPTNVNGAVRNYLSQGFVNPTCSNCGTQYYNGQDRREIFLGNASPYFGKITCVYEGGTQDWYVTGHNYNQNFPISTELPHLTVQDSSKGCAPNGMQSSEEYAPLVMLTYETNPALAKTMFMQTVTDWTGSSWNDGFVGGCTSNCAVSARALAEWLIMARATGFWTLAPASMISQIQKAIWSYVQNAIQTGSGFAPETEGQVLLAFDPRLPSWFTLGSISLAASATSVTVGTIVIFTITVKSANGSPLVGVTVQPTWNGINTRTVPLPTNASGITVYPLLMNWTDHTVIGAYYGSLRSNSITIIVGLAQLISVLVGIAVLVIAAMGIFTVLAIRKK